MAATAVHRATRRAAAAPPEPNGRLTGMDLLDRLPTEVVQTPAGDVVVRGLGALDLVELGPLAAALADEDQAGQLRVMVDIAARGLGMAAEDAGRLPLSVIRPVFAAAARLSGLDESAVAEAADSLKALPNDES